MLNALIVGLGGAFGAVARYLIGLLPLSPDSGFPVKTFLINIAGAFLIGIIAALASKNSISPRLVLFLKVGICGGFTTFSSFALESNQLIQGGKYLTAALYIAGSIALGILAVILAEMVISAKG